MCCNLIAQEQAGRAGARAWGGMGGARSWGTSGMGSGRRGGIRTCMTVARRSTGAAAGCPGLPGCAYSTCTVSPGVQGACCQPAHGILALSLILLHFYTSPTSELDAAR